MTRYSSRLYLSALIFCGSLPLTACDSPAPPAAAPAQTTQEPSAPGKAKKAEVHTLPPITQ